MGLPITEGLSDSYGRWLPWDEDDTLCFIEVVGVRSEDGGMPADDVSSEKRRRMELLAMDYLQQADMRSNTSVRFDIITITATHDATASSFANVKSIQGIRRRGVIKVNEPMAKNQVYVEPGDYDFVYGYIVEHCPDAEVRG